MSEQPTPEEVVAQAEAVVESAASAPAEEDVAPEARRGAESDEVTEETPDWEVVAMERTADLQRLQAEYVNYKKRVDRDRALARQLGIEAVVTDLMPVLDAIQLAKSHGDLDGGFKMVADELEKVAAKHGLVIFGAGSGMPYFSTDTVAAQRALEIGAEVLLMGKQGVDGVYDSDPRTNPEARRYERLTHDEFLSRDLKVADATAIALARDNALNIIFFNLSERGNIGRVVQGEPIGTFVSR